jgi:F0F1-type ATP synthase membrane subunit b/b'
MKVETELRAGALLESAMTQAGQAANQVSSFVNQANQQATNLTSTVVDKATAFWNCLNNAF